MSKPKKEKLLPVRKSRDIYSSKSFYRFYYDYVLIDNDPTWPLFPHVFMDNAISGEQWCQHWNYPYIAIEIILEGSVEYVTDSQNIKTGPGDIFLIVPGSCTKIINGKNKKNNRKMVIILRGNCPGLLCQNMGLNRDTLLKNADDGRFRAMVQEIGTAMKENTPNGILSQMAYKILSELAMEHRRSGALLPNDMQYLKNYLNNNFNASLSIDDMAAYCGCSKSTLIRRFKANFNTTPQLFLNKLRLEHARIMLQETDLPVKEIAFRCGFATASHFGAVFRKFYDTSPAAYRSL